LTELPAPVIASVQGLVAGGGLGVALAADLCIAAAGSRFHFAYPVIGASAASTALNAAGRLKRMWATPCSRQLRTTLMLPPRLPRRS
ncbi:MAG TPA: enoyl-CoA hydratase-related protein, partial [Ramlibacter sp.]|nr:enoyl-CoA hydratase-related protein [Ramlibacter sp.]